MFHDAFNRIVMWFRSIPWSRTDKIAAAVVGSVLAILVACAGCAALANTLGATTGQTTGAAISHPTATLHPRATPHPTATRQPTAIPRPTATPVPIGPPRLGGNISAFLRVYGKPTSQSNPSFGDYHFREYPGSYQDYLIVDTGDIVGDTTTGQLVASILVQSPPNQPWSLTQVEGQCDQFLPPDAKHIKTYAPPASGNPGDLDVVYTSANLARVFPAKDFQDANKNPTVDGSFDVSYVSFGAIGEPDKYDSCSIIIGEQQTQD